MSNFETRETHILKEKLKVLKNAFLEEKKEKHEIEEKYKKISESNLFFIEEIKKKAYIYIIIIFDQKFQGKSMYRTSKRKLNYE